VTFDLYNNVPRHHHNHIRSTRLSTDVELILRGQEWKIADDVISTMWQRQYGKLVSCYAVSANIKLLNTSTFSYVKYISVRQWPVHTWATFSDTFCRMFCIGTNRPCWCVCFDDDTALCVSRSADDFFRVPVATAVTDSMPADVRMFAWLPDSRILYRDGSESLEAWLSSALAATVAAAAAAWWWLDWLLVAIQPNNSTVQYELTQLMTIFISLEMVTSKVKEVITKQIK